MNICQNDNCKTETDYYFLSYNYRAMCKYEVTILCLSCCRKLLEKLKVHYPHLMLIITKEISTEMKEESK